MENEIMDLSIIIPTKNRGPIFDEALRNAVTALEELNAEIIVVNDHKFSKPFIPREFTNVRMVDNPKDGVASARNYGAMLSKSEFIIFMDDDMIITKKTISKTISINLKDPKKIHLFNWVYPPAIEAKLERFQFGRYLRKFGFTTLQGWMDTEWLDEPVFELKGGSSQFLTIKKTLFVEIGGYDENFSHAGAEDFDFFKRATKKGIRFYLDKSCTLYHNEEDRIELLNWLDRKRRNGETMEQAVRIGHTELAVTYSHFKRFVLSFFSKIKSLFFLLQRLIPNFLLFDLFYFKLTNILLAIYIFEGYTKNKKVK